MRKTHFILMLVFVLFLNACATTDGKGDNQGKFPAFKDRYLGQKPPGLIPELFAPGIVSTEKHAEGYYVFTPDMKEFYFSRRGGKYKKRTLFVMQYQNNKWGKASVLSTDINAYRERFRPYWSERSSVLKKAPFKDIPITGFSVSSQGTYYFYTLDGEGQGRMSYSRLIDGSYEKPQKMHEGINKGIWIAHPFIAPDESYFIWDAEQEGVYGADIYISFRRPDGSWGEAIGMGDRINTADHEQGASLTPDGKYLLFWRGVEKHREDGTIYWTGSPHWVDAQIIETLRPK